MMAPKFLSNTVCLFAISVGALVALPPTAYSEDKQGKSIQINVDTELEPAAAQGLFVSASGPIQLPVGEVQRVADNKLVVPVYYKESEIPKDSLATAIIISEQGELAFGNLRPVFSPDPRDSFWLIPQCAPEKINEAALAGQTSLLESLIEVRTERRRVALLALAAALNGDFLARLQKLEVSFGLENDPPLSAELSPVVLLDRLTRILKAIETYEVTNGKPDSK